MPSIFSNEKYKEAKIKELLVYLLLFIVMVYLVNQARKPTRWIGQIFVWAMNQSHSDVTDWGLKQVRIGAHFTILDVGCGGGRTIHKLAALAPEGNVYGIDYAEGSVAAARQKNAQLIKAGRVEIRQASVSQLPFPDNQFDLITAVETHYYWPDLVKDLQEIRRVLKPGGTLLLIAESYQGGRYEVVQGWVMKLLLRAAHLSVEEHRNVFVAAGFSEVQMIEDNRQGWLCGIGKAPSPS